MRTTLYKNFVITAGQHKLTFLSMWAILFAGMSLWLISIGLAPTLILSDTSVEQEIAGVTENLEKPVIVDTAYAMEAVDSRISEKSAPTRIIIDSIDVDTTVSNPTSTNIETLDQALTNGAVHYPGSGNLEDLSNMFLFGHSSRLPVVNNRAYKAFNNIEKLEDGDLIRVQSETHEYHYKVESVEEVHAEDAWVQFNSSEKRLTLSTCNNFGSKQDRFVVEAIYIGNFILVE